LKNDSNVTHLNDDEEELQDRLDAISFLCEDVKSCIVYMFNSQLKGQKMLQAIGAIFEDIHHIENEVEHIKDSI
jgi:hypothetical protein